MIDDAAKQFGKLAAQYSIEAGSNALEGEVPPIQRFSGRPLLEQEAFSLRAGELSGIVQLADKFVILFCEGRTKPIGAKFEEVRNQIADDIRDKKMRVAMADEFTKIQDSATIDNYLAGTTQSSKQDERGMFQRASAEVEVDPTVPRQLALGPRPGPDASRHASQRQPDRAVVEVSGRGVDARVGSASRPLLPQGGCALRKAFG